MNIIQNFKKRLAWLALAILCASCANAPAEARPDLDGVWVWPFYSPDDPRWRIEDLVCNGFCSKVGLEYLRKLLGDPRNDDKPLTALYDEMQEYNWVHITELLTPSARARLPEYTPEKDPAVDCDPDGDSLMHQIQAPLPFKFEQFDDRVVISYEYWNAVRTIYTDGRKPARDGAPTRLGHSAGRYDGSTLVVETSGIIPAFTLLPSVPPGEFLTHSSQARTIERYTLNEDGGRLDLEWTMIDPENFRRPLVGHASALRSAATALEEFVCEDTAGEIY